MKNFTNNFKQFTSRLSARWLIMSLMLLLGISSAWGWGFKYDDGGNWNTCSSSNFDNTTFYTDPTGSSTTSVYIKMHTGLVNTGFNITQHDDCGGQKLYVNLSGVASTSSNTIVRASARWVNNKGIYSEYTIVIPKGEIYIKPTNGDAVLMTKSTYTYTAELTLSDAMTFDLYADDPGNSTIENQDGMPSAGKPTSVRLNYTGLTSPYKYVKVSYNLKTNRITFTEMDPPCTPPDAPSLTNPDPQCGGFITLPASAEGVNLKWYDAQTGGNVVSDTEITATGTYWAAAVTECESTSRTAYTVTINPIPEVNSLLSTLNICIGSIDETDLTTLSHVEVSSGSTAVWYTSEDGVEQAEGANLINGGTYWVAAENSTTGCKSTTRTSFTIYINDLPEAPSLGKDEYETCAHASNTVNLDELAGVNNVIWYQDKDEEQNPNTISIANEGTVTYTAKAVNVNGCQSATGVDFTLTVNPLPTITSISASNDKPVPFEDVVLTADGVTSGAEINWYVGENLVAENTNTYIVTSETAGEVIVKAKAFLGNCESDFKEYKVTFSEEVCESPNKLVIWGKVISGKPTNNIVYCHAWKVGGSDITNWNGTEKTADSDGYYKWEFEVGESHNNIGIIFNNGKQTTNIENHKSGYKYIYDITVNTDKDWVATINGEPKKLNTLSAPAVKTVSATSEEGSGVVNFTGKIIKTGCADNSKIYYGYQYRLETDDWPTTGVQAGNDKLQLKSLTNASETALHYEFSSGDITLDNGKYVFRAYIINSYNFTNGNYDQGVYYGIDIPVTVSTQKDPIRNLQVKYANEKGVVLQDQNVTYCVRDNAYIKLIYDGSRLKPEEDEINISSTLENTFTLVEGEADDLYTFVVKGNETITVIAKNEENTVQGIDPATNSIDISTYVQPQTPSITLPEEMAVVCSNGVGATITVNEPQEGITYSLYIDGVAEAAQTKTPTEGTLQFTEIKTAGTYYVTAVNPSCPNNIAKSLDSKSIEVIEASANTIAIEPDEDTTNPWVPVKLKVTKNSVYDYTLVCKQDVTDVTESVVINKKDDIYTIKFPKPKDADITDDGQVEFDDIEYTVIVSLDGNVECGTTSATSEITLTQLVEDCTNN